MIYKKIYKESWLYAAFIKILGFERGIGKFIDDLDISLPHDGRILDVGCGSGIIGLRLLKRFPDSTLIATDIEKNFLNETVSNAKNGNIDVSRISIGISDINTPNIVKPLNGSTIFLEQNSFDIVSVGAALGYSKNRDGTLKELLGLVKSGGYFIDIDMNDGPVAHMVASNYHYDTMPFNKIKKIMESEGFEVSVDEFSMSHFPANLTRMAIVGKK